MGVEFPFDNLFDPLIAKFILYLEKRKKKTEAQNNCDESGYLYLGGSFSWQKRQKASIVENHILSEITQARQLYTYLHGNVLPQSLRNEATNGDASLLGVLKEALSAKVDRQRIANIFTGCSSVTWPQFRLSMFCESK